MYENIDKSQYTPMMRQYLSIKEEQKDALVFFRLGDFYELFFYDAVLASKELEIVLTGRDAGAKERVPMCGVPYHSVQSYIDRLIEKGYKVAIVDQVEDPKDAKGIVKREVTRVITPGIIMEGSGIQADDNNYLIGISHQKERYILTYTDLSTGENYLTNVPHEESILQVEILKLKAKEIVVPSTFPMVVLEPLVKLANVLISKEDGVEKLDYLNGLMDVLDKEEQITFLRMYNYINRTQKRTFVHLQKVIKYDINGYLKIDVSSRRNLELLETLRFQNKKNTLLNVMDKCQTAMGSRFLKKSLLFPLIDGERIEKRYDIIDQMKKHFLETMEVRALLEKVYDLERIVGKISYENANPRDLIQLKKSLSILPELKKIIQNIRIHSYFDLSVFLDDVKMLHHLLNRALKEDAPFLVRDGNVIKDGYHEELDELRNINKNSKAYLLSLEAREKERTGIKTLKVGFNRVFGYYIEVSKGSIEAVKEEYGYIRKQTLSNSERYITQELKEKETLILRAEEKTIELEIALFNELRTTCKQYIPILQSLARVLSELDMMQSFTKIANENHYVRPQINHDNILAIRGGRHPVLEQHMDEFIPNDLAMTNGDSIVILTGPNMSGKSTFMRQIALIVIMAQMGSFVSATSAKIPLFDAIFTRIGAADDIVSGQSTFMVEMMEVNNALQQATENSLVILDEIGRGTATYDGMALAQAIIEYIHEEVRCKTLFSTHYHELTSLEIDLKNVVNLHVAADEVHGDVVFIHKVQKGAVDRSYGINVAKLAKLPLPILLRSEDILNKLQEHHGLDKKVLSIQQYQAPLLYDSKSEKESVALKRIQELSLNEMSPLDAMNALNDIQKLLKK